MKSIHQISVNNPLVYAFRISGEVAAEDLEMMATAMNRAFDAHPSVSMLLIFENYDGVKAGAGFDMENFKAQFRSLSKVDKYAMVGAPGFAATMIEVMDKVIPIDARTFDSADEQAAWAFVDAQPISQGTSP